MDTRIILYHVFKSQKLNDKGVYSDVASSILKNSDIDLYIAGKSAFKQTNELRVDAPLVRYMSGRQTNDKQVGVRFRYIAGIEYGIEVVISVDGKDLMTLKQMKVWIGNLDGQERNTFSNNTDKLAMTYFRAGSPSEEITYLPNPGDQAAFDRYDSVTYLHVLRAPNILAFNNTMRHRRYPQCSMSLNCKEGVYIIGQIPAVDGSWVLYPYPCYLENAKSVYG